MNEELKFELTWTQGTGSREPEPYLAFEVFDEANQAKKSYATAFQVCATPRCPCLSICLYCAPLLPNGTVSSCPLRRFWLDVEKRDLDMTPEVKAEPETLGLAQSVSARLGDKEWEQLHRWFWAAKIRTIETADVSQIDIADLPDADDGRMVPFIEVFPLGLSLNFTFEQADWAADEAYCVQPRCGCTQTVLYFLKLRDSAGKKADVLENVPAIRYNYQSHATEMLAPGTAGTPPTAMLFTMLRTAFPSLDSRLELHHRIMQFLYARHYLEGARHKTKTLEAQVRAKTRKPGRNDPCPCGSGKKFKKCCGA